ncbi:MAG: VanW family protein [Candidatus Saccharibacteria bacterium]
MKKKLVFFTFCILSALILVVAILAIADISEKEATRKETKQVTTETPVPAISVTASSTSQPMTVPKPTAKPKPTPLALIAKVTSVPANAELISSAKIVLRDEPGTTNAAVAAKIVNGYILRAGETFSYNGVVGERTLEKGFIWGTLPIKDANGNEVIIKSVGSGVCRLSVGLATAAKGAGLRQIEITAHQYIPWYFSNNKGLVDATVYWDSKIDNKFKNTKDYNILIQCNVADYILHVNFYKLV